MNVGISFTLCSFFFISLLCVAYFSKKRINNTENTIYSGIALTSLFGTIIGVPCYYFMANMFDYAFLNYIFSRLYLVYLLTWLMLFSVYVLVISFPKINYKKLSIWCYILYIIFILITWMLPLYYNNSDAVYSYGPSVNFVYIISIVFIIILLGCLFKNIKIIKQKKYFPLIFFILFGTIIMIIQKLNPGLLLLTFGEAFITFLMYFTIENPDLKMLNELELAKNNAERANNAKTEFLSSMSHEIRTPLNAIVGFSNSIMEDKTLEEAQDEAKDIIMASNNLLEIVNGILDISKIEAGKMEIVNVDYKPIPMYEDIVKLIKPRIGEKPIELKCKFSSDIPAVLNGDMGKVKEIITNLLTNAAKYTDKGIITFEVSCINQKNTSKLVISVEDTGRGIKPDKIDKLFTKFNRLEEDRNTTLEGTGLGLAITKSLVDMMGGKIIVQSKYGSGSKFTVYLSQKIVSMDEGIVEQKEKEEVKEIDYSNKSILVVDDNNLNIKVASRLLKNYNIIPDNCISGYECIEKVKNKTYDLILMDDMMPKMSGVETFHKLKEDSNFNTPVVILTANAVSGMKEKYLSEGLNDYLAKPIDKLELDRVLNEYLKKK